MNFTVLSSAASPLDMGGVLLDLALVVIVARLAAEIFERVGLPAVIGEIVAGVLLGPSVLGLVAPTDALGILAEVGVVILLAQVGLETDIDELRRVGRASVLVACIGVIVPVASGYAMGIGLGESSQTGLFLGAALAATSVGITARVFGDLRALASAEARIVLGAAVADDVLGLVLLTVATRIVERGSIDTLALLSTVGVAVGFLVVAGIVAVWIVPRIIGGASAGATSPATVGVLAAGTTFAFAAAASKAELAPIIGAFVAGIALGRTSHHDRISRDFSALGNVFIPVFFLRIGVDTDVGAFTHTNVLAIAAGLFLIAFLGKLASAAGAVGTNTDRLLIGFGMVPRGEVGLIFASVGVTVGVFDTDLYAAVVLAVLATTVVAPPLLRWRLHGAAGEPADETGGVAEEPAGGWIRVIDDRIELQGQPPAGLTLALTLRAAIDAGRARPDDTLVTWLHARRNAYLRWDEESTHAFVDMIARGTPRGWRLLEITGTIRRALPEVARAIDARRFDASELDPTAVARFPVLESLRPRLGKVGPEDCDLALAAFLADLPDPQMIVSSLERTHLPRVVLDRTRSLLAAAALLRSVAGTEPYEANPRVLAQLADFLGSPLQVERCRLLTEAIGGLEDWQFGVLLEITTGVQALLAHPELIEGHEDSVESIRRRDALALATDERVRDRIEQAAATYILSHEPEVIVRQATLVEPAPRGRTVRVGVHDSSVPGQWEIDIAARDRRGLLARICGVLASSGLDIIAADLSTWPDGAVLDSFTVSSATRPDAARLAQDIESCVRRRIQSPQGESDTTCEVTLDNDAHPWHSVVCVYGSDQPGLLQAVAAAFASANVHVHHARISTRGGLVADRFEVSTRHGRKIGDSTLSRVRNRLT